MAESRDYKIERLNQTFSLFESSEEPDYEIKARVGDAGGGLGDIIKAIDELAAANPASVDPDSAKQAKIQAIANSVTTRNKALKTLDFVSKPDIYENLSPSSFAFNAEADTFEGMLAPADANAAGAKPNISTFAFKSELDKTTMFREYLEYTYKVVTTRVIDEAETAANTAGVIRAAKDLKAKQLKLIVEEIGKIKSPKARQAHDNNLVTKAKSDMLGQNYLGSTLQGEIVQCPKLGTANLLVPNDLKSINIFVNNNPFIPGRSTRPLNLYLDFCAGIISDTYNKDAAFSILLHCLGGEARKTTDWAKKLDEDFESLWSKLQVYYTTKQSAEQVNNQIKNILHERPAQLGETFGRLLNLIRLKYDDNESDTLDVKKVLMEKECKLVYFRLLKTWWPYMFPIIQQRFYNAVQHAKMNGGKEKPPSEMILFISKEIIGSTAAVHRRNAQVYSLDCEGMITEEFLDESQNYYLDETDRARRMQMLEASDVEAFRGSQNRSGGAGLQRKPGQFTPKNTPLGGGAAPRPQNFRIPDHLKARCLLCASKDHAYSYCKKYPGATPVYDGTWCNYCRGLHPSPCESLGHKYPPGQVSELTAEQQGNFSPEESPDETYFASGDVPGDREN